MILRLYLPVVELVVIVTVGEALEQSVPNGINKQNSHSPQTTSLPCYQK